MIGGSDHDRIQTVTSSSMSTMTSWCVKCSIQEEIVKVYFYSAECKKSAWKKHKKTCKAPTSPPASEAELRVLHKGIALQASVLELETGPQVWY